MIPDGLGAFYGSRAMTTPGPSAARALACGATHAFVLVGSVDGRVQSSRAVSEACDSLWVRDVLPIPYSFPRADRWHEGVRRLADMADLVHAKKVLLDVEPYQGRDWTQGEIDSAVLYLRGVRRLEVSISIFPRRAWLKIKWPVTELVLQLYQTAADADDVIERVADYAEVTRVIPAVGTYLGDAARLARDFRNVEPAARKANAAAIWCLDALDHAESQVALDFTLRALG